ncbi:type II toxin-antitoxin system VapC family toxin [Candidatus Gottesmanbacteria bacterium]|nr:type II toxin-antitoxin system VapC family toxin [Candidatus Gottesmanbacteria bacterium]
MRVLLDSDFLVGTFRKDDPHHDKTKRILRRLQRKEVELCITNLVKQESATVISHKVSMDAVRQYMITLKQDVDTVLWIDAALEARAWKIFLQQTKKGCSFVDCANLATIEYYKLDGILSFDTFYPIKLRIGQ